MRLLSKSMRLLSNSEIAVVAGGDGDGESHTHEHSHRTSGGAFIRTTHTHTHTHGTGQPESQHIADVKEAQDSGMDYDPGGAHFLRDVHLGDKGHHDG